MSTVDTKTVVFAAPVRIYVACKQLTNFYFRSVKSQQLTHADGWSIEIDQYAGEVSVAESADHVAIVLARVKYTASGATQSQYFICMTYRAGAMESGTPELIVAGLGLTMKETKPEPPEDFPFLEIVSRVAIEALSS